MGAMGSGTTLLRLVLDSHPRIAIPPETGFMRVYNANRFVPFKWSGRRWAQRLGWSDAELDAMLRDFYGTLFMRYASEHGKARWGEKTPLHVWHWGDMARLFPDAVFVAIVRHPGGSIASNIDRWDHEVDRAVTHFERYTRELLRMAARFPRRTVLVRYEELLLDPEPVLRELLDWLGEPWSDAVLAHHEVQGARGGREIVEGRSRVTDPIDVSRMTRWMQTLDAPTRADLATRLDRLATFLGYSMTDPVALAPVGARRRRLISGREVRRRMRRHFPDLGLEVRGEVPPADQLYHPGKLWIETMDEREERLAGGPVHRRVREAWHALPRSRREAVRRARRRLP
jgi:hypothetical protein